MSDESPPDLRPALKSIAQEIRDYQMRMTLSDGNLCKRFAGLGSTKTYKRVLEGDFEQMDLDRQHLNFAAVVDLIRAELSADSVLEEDFDDFHHVEEARIAVTDALRENGNNRLVVIEGQSGCGKTTISRMLARRWSNVVLAEADPTWRALTTMLSDLIVALNPISRKMNDSQVPHENAGKKQKIFNILNERKRILNLDEGHHLTPEGLNFVKTMLNQTPTVVVLICIPSLLNRMEKTAYEECRQLMKNRLCARVHLNGPKEGDVAKFLHRRRVEFATPADAEQAARLLSRSAPSYGNFNFVNSVSRRARMVGGGKPIDIHQFIEAQQDVIKTR